ncbi:MAG: hypothetical protein RMM51_06755 [Verrucomicrobiae bacterium]|nr:hypothetical protein [Verrucomicrobiae bacterium]
MTSPNPSPPTNLENLVEIHRARDEWEGTLLLGLLQDHNINAYLRRPTPLPPLDAADQLTGNPRVGGLFVLEHDAERARQLVREFLDTAADESLLVEEAARRLRVDKDTIHRLRGELREEKRTFEFLGWVVVVFLASAALLWAIWPAWLKSAPPTAPVRWVMVVVLALCAVFVGNWTARKIR